MTTFKRGDVVEVIVPEDHEFASWNGMTFKVTEIKKNFSPSLIIIGTVLKEVPGKKYLIGDDINWNYQENLSLVSDTTAKQPETEKYFSPFSGKWT